MKTPAVMCIALTRMMPSAMPLSLQKAATSSVMRRSSRRFAVSKVRYLVWLFIAGAPIAARSLRGDGADAQHLEVAAVDVVELVELIVVPHRVGRARVVPVGAVVG